MGNATHRIYQIKYQINSETQIHQYTYDENHNITRIEVKESDVIIDQYDYFYDGFNQLTREDIEIDGIVSKTMVYSYDLQNNITSIKTFDYQVTTGTPQNEKKMFYQNTWKDQLTRIEYYVSGSLSYYQTFTYDASGNVIGLVDSRTSYENKSYQWDGRQLTQISAYCDTLYFKYNDQGIRTQKINNTCNGSVTTDFTLDGDKVLVETRSNGITLYFTYDVDGTLLSMNYNGAEYFYITNMQGDIIELVDINGDSVVKYKYDAWGNIIDQTGGSLADINPYRYRGYRFDVETGLYYLQSRYYDPAIGRFISSDGLLGETGNLATHNMYAYANNNSAMNSDPNGELALEITVSGVILIAGLLLAIYALIMQDNVFIPNSNGLADGFQNFLNKIDDEKENLIGILASLAITNTSSLGKYDWHHIVAQKDPRAYLSRLMLDRAGINIHDQRNLSYVSRPMHWVMHTNEYHASVTLILLTGYAINGEQGVIDALAITKQIIEKASGKVG